MLPALKTIAEVLYAQAPGRAVEAGGLPATAAATALGCAFLAPAGLQISWRQCKAGRCPQLWNLESPREASGFTAQTTGGDVSASDLAVLVSVTANVELAFAASKTELPRFRAITCVTKPGMFPHDLPTPGQALDVAHIVIKAIRRAREEYPPINTIHLFMAVPVGLAMMIGQLLNTCGPVQTYEHIPTDATGRYRSAALLTPSL